MLKTIAAAVAGVIALSWIGDDPAQAQQGHPFSTHRNWRVEAFGPDAGRGNFPHCAARTRFGAEHEIRITFGWPRGSNHAVLGIEFIGAGSTALGAKFPVKFWFGGKDDATTPTSSETAATAVLLKDVDRTWARIEERAEGPGSEDGLANAAFIYIQSGQEQWPFPLAGSNAAIHSMIECARKQVAAMPAPAKPQPGGKQVQYPVESDAHRMGEGCPKLGEFMSPPSKSPAMIEFTSRVDRAVTAYWIDFKGNPVDYGGLLENETLNFNTFVGHYWIAKDFDGRCYGSVIEAQPGVNRIVVQP